MEVFTAPKARPASYVVKFKAHLVLEDAVSKELRRSPHPGELSVNPTDRVVHYAYKPKKSNSHMRTLREPRKCVVSALGLKIWSSDFNSSVTCSFVSEREKECCLEALQLMGARVVDVTPRRSLSHATKGTHSAEAHAGNCSLYDGSLTALEAAIAHPRRRHDVTSFAYSYCATEQLPSDIVTISRAWFGGSS